MEELNFLAKVGDKVITQEDLEAAVASLDGYQRQQFDNEEGRKRILADMINQELFYLDALENKMDQDEIFVNEMELVKANMLKQYAINACLAAIEITDDEKLAYYEEHKDEFKEDESASAKHILVDNEELAAVEYSTCPSKSSGGSLGTFGRGQMVPEFEEAVFTLPVGKVSSPVKTQFGYHLILVDDRKEARQLEYEDCKSDVEQSLAFKKQNEAFLAKLTDLTEKYKDILTIKGVEK